MARAKFTDRVTTADASKMPQEYRDLVIRLLTIQADCEIGGPNAYGAHWCLDAPTLEDMIRVTGIIRQELEHFQAFNEVLRALGADRTDLLHRPPAERYVDAFRASSPATWADVAAFCCLIDRVGAYQVAEMVDSSLLALDDILPDIAREEEGHVRFGARRLGDLAANPETKPAAQAAVTRWYPRALDMFGKSASARAERYVEWGLKKRLNEEGRRDYISEVRPILQGMGLYVPVDTYDRRYP